MSDRATASWTSPPRPAWVERLNTVGDNVGGAGNLVALDESSLIDAATRATGLSDFGETTWREPFGVLLDAIAREANLNTVGRMLTRSEIVRILENRLRITDTLRAHPEILKGEIHAPLVISGTARSGTSILHELLALDPAHRTPRAWEVMYSVPPPETATYETDPRIERADREVTLWHEIAPEYVAMHANGGALPHECIFLMSHEFASAHFSGVLDVPSYALWLATHDLAPAFRFHRRQLQLLQWRHPGERWLLKAPSHLTVLPALFSVYPDARLVLTHRDPAKTVASTISLMATLRHMRRDHVDVAALAQQLGRGMAIGLEKVIQERAERKIPDAQIVDLQYHDLMRDPVGAIRGLYERLELELTRETEERMRAYLAAKPRGKHGSHSYSLEAFGLDRDAMRERYAGYMRHYGVNPET